MKRFLLFRGSTYYPEGGWEDFGGDFDTEAEAIREVANSDSVDWWHVVDTQAVPPAIVDSGRRD